MSDAAPQSPLLRADVSRLADFLRRHDPLGCWSEDALERVIFDDPDFSPGSALKLVAPSGEWLAVAVGVVRRAVAATGASPEPEGFIKILTVAEPHRGASLGSHLLSTLERSFEDQDVRGISVDGAAPAYFAPGLLEDRRAAREFFVRRGYRDEGSRQSLRVVLSAVDLDVGRLESRLEARGFEVRRARREEAPALREAIAREFSPCWGIEVELAVCGMSAGVQVALRDGEFAAFAARGGASADAFGPMATWPQWRGEGLGEVLLRRSLAELAGRGEREAVIHWVGPLEYYRRMIGPLEVVRYRVLRKTLEERPERDTNAGGMETR